MEFDERTYTGKNYRGNNCGELYPAIQRSTAWWGTFMYLSDPELEITYEITELSETSVIWPWNFFDYDDSIYYGYDIYTRVKWIPGYPAA